MFAENLLKYSSILQIALCIAALTAIIRRKAVRDFRALTAFIGWTIMITAIFVPILFYRQALHIPRMPAYYVLFYSFWISRVVDLVMLVMIIYGLFAEAMRPFPGLQRIGKIVFRWVGAVSLIVALALCVGPQLFAKGAAASDIFNELATRFQQGINVLILCLLVFVCFAIRPLGLTFRSYMFGVVLGLGIDSTGKLVQSAWLATAGAHSLYSPIYSLGALGTCAALGVWTAYFGMKEPERKLILLPTTSPFFLWNRISEILGDAPGQVAVAGFKPEMLAPAELEMLTAATARESASDLEREEALIGGPAGSGGFRARIPSSARPSLALSR